MNEEDPERDRARRRRFTRRTPSATALPRCRRLVPPCYVPEGDSPLSLYATVGGRLEGGGFIDNQISHHQKLVKVTEEKHFVQRHF